MENMKIYQKLKDDPTNGINRTLPMSLYPNKTQIPWDIRTTLNSQGQRIGETLINV